MKNKKILIFIFGFFVFVSGREVSSKPKPLTPEQRIALHEEREEETNKARQKVEQKALEIHKIHRMAGRPNYKLRTNPKDILVYYIKLNRIPDRYGLFGMNKTLYIMGSYSEPQKKYIKIAKVSVGKAIPNDAVALAEMKIAASQEGGDALIDVYREPITGGIRESSYVNTPFGPATGVRFARDVAGFIYHGIVIRFKDADSIL